MATAAKVNKGQCDGARQQPSDGATVAWMFGLLARSYPHSVDYCDRAEGGAAGANGVEMLPLRRRVITPARRAAADNCVPDVTSLASDGAEVAGEGKTQGATALYTGLLSPTGSWASGGRRHRRGSLRAGSAVERQGPGRKVLRTSCWRSAAGTRCASSVSSCWRRNGFAVDVLRVRCCGVNRFAPRVGGKHFVFVFWRIFGAHGGVPVDQ